MNWIPIITHFLMFLAGAGIATLFWYFCFKEQEGEHRETVRDLEKRLSNSLGRNVALANRLREITPFKPARDASGRFARKEAA